MRIFSIQPCINFRFLFSTHRTGSQWKHWRCGARCSHTRLVHQEQQGENTSPFQILEWRNSHICTSNHSLLLRFFLRTKMWLARQKRFRWRCRKPIFWRKIRKSDCLNDVRPKEKVTTCCYNYLAKCWRICSLSSTEDTRWPQHISLVASRGHLAIHWNIIIWLNNWYIR